MVAGFPPRFVQWIKKCITIPKFLIAINGSLVDYFNGRKLLGQRDPLSPNLLVVAMEAFNRLFKSKVVSSSLFKYHPKCKGKQITHLSFADDLFIYSDSDLSSIHIIKESIEEFKYISRLYKAKQK